MNQKLKRIKLAFFNKEGYILLHDNTRPYVSITIRQKLHTLNYKVSDHPSYSSDFSLTDFHFFNHLDDFLQEKYFRNPKNAETAFNEFVASRTTTFYDTGIKNFFLVCKSVMKLMIPILINNVCFVKINCFFK